MSKTEKAITDYGLDKFKLMEGSGAIMAAVLGDKRTSIGWHRVDTSLEVRPVGFEVLE
jgi:hypothetical protein